MNTMLRDLLTEETDILASDDQSVRVRVATALIAEGQFSADPGRHHYAMSLELPQSEELRGSGESPREAFVAFCGVISDAVFPEAHSLNSRSELLDAIRAKIMADSQPSPPVRTKEGQKSIGVSAKAALVEGIRNISETRGLMFAEVARGLFERGFEELDARLDHESSKKVVGEFQLALSDLPGPDAKQWSLRMERSIFGRTMIFAHQQKKSLSAVAAMCIAYSLQKKLF